MVVVQDPVNGGIEVIEGLRQPRVTIGVEAQRRRIGAEAREARRQRLRQDVRLGRRFVVPDQRDGVAGKLADEQ